MTNFFDTEAGQHASLAKVFLEGARILDDAQPKVGRILFRPTLALAGHSLELMLKACYYLNGEKPPTSGERGHKIQKLWAAEVCEPARGHIYLNAYIVLDTLREDQRYIDLQEEKDLAELIEEYIISLCNLHGQRGYPLRYPGDPELEAPRTPFPVNTLWRTADDFVKRPSDFTLGDFRGRI